MEMIPERASVAQLATQYSKTASPRGVGSLVVLKVDGRQEAAIRGQILKEDH